MPQRRRHRCRGPAKSLIQYLRVTLALSADGILLVVFHSMSPRDDHILSCRRRQSRSAPPQPAPRTRDMDRQQQNTSVIFMTTLRLVTRVQKIERCCFILRSRSMVESVADASSVSASPISSPRLHEACCSGVRLAGRKPGGEIWPVARPKIMRQSEHLPFMRSQRRLQLRVELTCVE